MKKNKIVNYIKSINTNNVLFVITYALFTLAMEPGIMLRMARYINTYRLIIFFLFSFVINFIVVVLNSKYLRKCIKIYCIQANIVLAVYVIDYFARIFTNNENYMRMLWVSSAFVASLGIYAGLLFSSKSDFKLLSKNFWLGFSPTYAFAFILVFLRKPNTYFELNLVPGNGMLSYTNYFINSFEGDYWMVYNFIGNVVFFIPLIFLMNTFFSKIKTMYSAMLCFVIPFIVEGYQYVFKCGSVDIDDIILNSSGVIIGVLLYILINYIKEKKHIKQSW